jgi:NAD+ synthetase
MNFYPDSELPLRLSDEQQQVLNTLRQYDPWKIPDLVQQKAERLNDYFRKYGLKSCVVGVSGGIDSALVLALCKHAMELPKSPIERIVPVLMPVYHERASTGQRSATERGRECASAFGLEPIVLDLTPAHSAVQGIVDTAMRSHGKPWALGQLVSYQRTPALYYVTSLLSEARTPGVVVGTTNYDEGAYIGYFGKASDGMVDLQLISDLHKHDVVRMARFLGVPDSILMVEPTGDMYDGRTDEKVFGFTYDALEYDLRARYQPMAFSRLRAVLGHDDLALRQKVNDLHGYNHHKYMGRSPAIHLDVLSEFRHFEGVWEYFVWKP